MRPVVAKNGFVTRDGYATPRQDENGRLSAAILRRRPRPPPLSPSCLHALRAAAFSIMNGHHHHSYQHTQPGQYDATEAIPPIAAASDSVQDAHQLLAAYPYGSATPATHGPIFHFIGDYMLTNMHYSRTSPQQSLDLSCSAVLHSVIRPLALKCIIPSATVPSVHGVCARIRAYTEPRVIWPWCGILGEHAESGSAPLSRSGTVSLFLFVY